MVRNRLQPQSLRKEHLNGFVSELKRPQFGGGLPVGLNNEIQTEISTLKSDRMTSSIANTLHLLASCPAAESEYSKSNQQKHSCMPCTQFSGHEFESIRNVLISGSFIAKSYNQLNFRSGSDSLCYSKNQSSWILSGKQAYFLKDEYRRFAIECLESSTKLKTNRQNAPKAATNNRINSESFRHPYNRVSGLNRNLSLLPEIWKNKQQWHSETRTDRLTGRKVTHEKRNAYQCSATRRVQNCNC